ncbi:glycosyl hydrolase [Oscillatoria amoena NRMC-F 0135]|nr:glycosyl hydrolase [Oscillatoria amoena NRMC-F 0135]
MTENKSIMSFYPQNRRPFQKINFTNPPAAFRGYPFWSWNTRLEKGKLLRQLGFFKDMGMGGATIHCRTGLDTAYMGPEYMDIVRASVDWARKNGMFIWLYDEDRWPSGYGGGLVTVDPRYRARHLLWTCRPYGPGDNHPQEIHASTAGTGRTGNGKLLYIFDVELDAEGCLRSYRPRAAHDRSQPRGRLWYAYLEIAPEQPWFNYQTYVDTLNADAIRRFTATTHEVYKDSLRKDFGKTVPTIFTDEPQFTHKMCFNRADEQRDIVVPFTDDLPQTFREIYGESLETHLPELFWELPKGRASVTRCRYHDHVAERFARAFADTLGRWCRRNGIALTGHMMEEPTLATQTGALGEAMRSYRSFDLPGIDILCDHHPETDGHPIEFTTAKQAQSASRQYGREGVMSEIYGVTNWDFTFAGHKAQGDWQAALGVTARVHHLSLVTLEGEAKRDFPSSIFYQSPWFREYPLIETHFARINSLMTRGKPVVRVGVIHPVESYWLCFGPKEQTGEERKSRDQQFESLTRWLVHSLVDYDFISESLLPAQCARVTGKTLNVGKMRYECVIVPGMRTIRSTTLDRLEAFARAGGTVVFAGEIPTLVDAVASNRAKALADRASHVEFTDWALSRAIEPFRDLGAYRQDNGLLVEQFAAQCRDEGNARYVFVCNTHRALVMDSSRNAVDTVIRIKGSWRVEEFDTLTGQPAGNPREQMRAGPRWLMRLIRWAVCSCVW